MESKIKRRSIFLISAILFSLAIIVTLNRTVLFETFTPFIIIFLVGFGLISWIVYLNYLIKEKDIKQALKSASLSNMALIGSIVLIMIIYVLFFNLFSTHAPSSGSDPAVGFAILMIALIVFLIFVFALFCISFLYIFLRIKLSKRKESSH